MKHSRCRNCAAGYLDFAGDMDTCIALRTIVYSPAKSGAGVAADSIPASKYDETLIKAKAMPKAVEIAQSGF